MKKLTFILAFGAMLALTACGSGSTTTETTDPSLAPISDSTLGADSTAVPVQGGEVPVEGETSVSHEAVK